MQILVACYRDRVTILFNEALQLLLDLCLFYQRKRDKLFVTPPWPVNKLWYDKQLLTYLDILSAFQPCENVKRPTNSPVLPINHVYVKL
jgi:hypothetical protein